MCLYSGASVLPNGTVFCLLFFFLFFNLLLERKRPGEKGSGPFISDCMGCQNHHTFPDLSSILKICSLVWVIILPNMTRQRPLHQSLAQKQTDLKQNSKKWFQFPQRNEICLVKKSQFEVISWRKIKRGQHQVKVEIQGGFLTTQQTRQTEINFQLLHLLMCDGWEREIDMDRSMPRNRQHTSSSDGLYM